MSRKMLLSVTDRVAALHRGYLLIRSRPRATSAVPDVQDADTVIEHAVEYLEGIATKRNGVSAGPLLHLRGAERVLRYTVDNRSDASFQSLGHPVAKNPTAVGR